MTDKKNSKKTSTKKVKKTKKEEQEFGCSVSLTPDKKQEASSAPKTGPTPPNAENRAVQILQG